MITQGSHSLVDTLNSLTDLFPFSSCCPTYLVLFFLHTDYDLPFFLFFLRFTVIHVYMDGVLKEISSR